MLAGEAVRLGERRPYELRPVIRDANQWDEGDGMASVSVRYIVDDVAAALAFYCDELDFHRVMHPASTFAMLDRGELRLVLSAPSGQGGGGQAIPDGAQPNQADGTDSSSKSPDIADRIQLLPQIGVHFRNEIIDGVGGKQIILDDRNTKTCRCTAAAARAEPCSIWLSSTSFGC
jgi:catechol 2,3-dioxygenase-like lactoylglutathione lyase family enzyme